jgi:tricorn protease
MREGKDITTPIEAVFGPKVMIINELAGPGGDALPGMFRRTGIGPLIGKRIWGGLVRHYTNPADFMDGGFAGTPNLAFFSPDGTWDLENHGVPPDLEVVMELLKKNLPPTTQRPAYPHYLKQEAVTR